MFSVTSLAKSLIMSEYPYHFNNSAHYRKSLSGTTDELYRSFIETSSSKFGLQNGEF